MAIQFVNYSLDDFNNDQTDSEDPNSFWNSAELQRSQNLNHSRTPNINQVDIFFWVLIISIIFICFYGIMIKSS